MKTIKSSKIVAVGHLLADILAPVSDDFLSNHGFLKGDRLTAKRPIISGLMGKLQGRYTIAPGGSACNTLIGAAGLGAQATFAAKCGQDQLGALVLNTLAATGVTTHISKDKLPTGICLSLVTPEGERTMLVDLAASDALSANDVPQGFFQDAGIAHFEAYMLINRGLTLNLLDQAYNAGCLITLDLGSFSIVREHAAFLREIITNYVDVLIGNFAEGAVFAGIENDESILNAMSRNVAVAALKKGARGSQVCSGGEILAFDAATSDKPVIDTTGAGDLWNSGFLYGLANGYDLRAAGRLASLCGYAVCCEMGAQIKPESWSQIKSYLTASTVV